VNAKASNADIETDAGMLGTGYMLVHRSSRPQFTPLRLMNPVTLLGRLPTNDVVLVSDNVSRRHAKLIITDLGVTVHDLDSHNGVCLNGKKVRSSPVKPGDLVYVGDMCVELRRVPGAEGMTPNTQVAQKDLSAELSEEDDSRSRALAALVRVSELLATAPDDAWTPLTLEVCRELVEATVAAFVEVQPDGSFTTPVVLQPGSSRRGPVPVLWPAVQQCFDTKKPFFVRDVHQETKLVDLKPTDPRAVMVVPVAVGSAVQALLFFSRAQAGGVFSEVELEALEAIARQVALRVAVGLEPAEKTTTGIDDRTGMLAAQARLAAAEEQLASEQQEVQRLTERVHALEGDNLKLKQQGEIERHGISKREGEREREAIAKLEKAVTDAKKQTKELHELRRELEQVKSDLAREQDEVRLAAETAAKNDLTIADQRSRADAAEDALAAARAEILEAQTRLQALEAERDTLTTDVERLRNALREESERAVNLTEVHKEQETKLAALQGAEEQVTSLRTAVRSSLLPTLAEHVEALAAGTAPAVNPAPRPMTAAYVALADFDTFCETAEPDEVKRTLDTFCAAVTDATTGHGGRVEQVAGHAHLVAFGAEPADIQAAVRTAAMVVQALGDRAVVAGVHTGLGVAGFFGGPGQTAAFIEAGMPVMVARGAIDFAPSSTRTAPPQGIVISDAVRAALEGQEGFGLVALGPCWVRGLQGPLSLSVVTVDSPAAGGAHE
jgi:class 3 adenylate cyclase